MSTLQITCFQSMTARLGDTPVAFRTARGRALLVYLAIEQGRAHQRSTLAGFFWPDRTESRARRNLSQNLLEVRKALVDEESVPPFLHVSTQTIAFNSECQHQIDVVDFQRATQEQDYALAVALYKGSFLDGFSIPDSDLFEAWMQSTRERLHQQVVQAFTGLSNQQEEEGNLGEAMQTTRRLLSLAPWKEGAHYQLMRLLAIDGQRSAALAQYDTLTQMLMDELGVLPASGTDALYDQILAGEVGAAPNTQSIAASLFKPISQPESPFQAPAPPPHFVGRETEIEQLTQGLSNADTPIWALVGMGGSGKTTLAMRVAHLLRDDFADGILWANTATSQPIDILNQWGAAFGYDFGGLPDLESRAAAVRGMLAEKSVLIVLDNVDAAEAVRPLLPGHATCGLLLTTRNLDVAHALNAEALLLGELSSQSGLALLRHILGTERMEAEQDAAEQICQMLHYLPLALEITAQRLKSRTRVKLTSMAQRLSKEQHRLGLEISDRAVRTSFEVSWDGLDEAHQGTFAHLAVFRGRPLTVDALAHVVDDDPFYVEDQLYSLVALSLLQEERESHFRQHPLLADFAQEKLGNHDSAKEPYARFADYYADFAERNQAEVENFDPEWGNVYAAIEYSVQLDKWLLVINFANKLYTPWFKCGRYEDARQGFTWATEAAKQLGDEAAIALNTLRAGEASLEQSQYSIAQNELESSLHKYMELEEDVGVAESQFHLARIALEQGHYDHAETLLNSALQIRQIIDDKVGVAMVKYRQARLYFAHDNLDEAERTAQTALTMQEALDDLTGQIPTLRLLAHIASKQEQFEQAEEFAVRAKAQCETIGDKGELSAIHYTLACIYRDREEYPQAKIEAQQSLTLARQMGLQQAEGILLYQLSIIHNAQADIENAIILGQESLKIRRLLHNELGCALTLRHLGDLYLQCSQIDDAKETWTEAVQIASRLEHPSIGNTITNRLNAL